MDIVKKNLLSIICGVVAIAAIIALFWPLGPMYAVLQSDLDKSKAQHDQLIALENKERLSPVIDPEDPNQQRLPQFPGPELISQGDMVTKKVEQQSKAMLEKAVKLNEHQPLVPDALPTKGQASAGNAHFDFRNKYQKLLREDLLKELRATAPPTPEEIQAAKDRLWEQKYKDQIIYINGQPNNEEKVRADFEEEAATLGDAMRIDRASRNLVYVDPGTFAASSRIGPNSTPTPEDIWYAQVALWIQQDVASAIKGINEPFGNILKAPVKHLRKLDIPEGPAMYVGMASAGGSAFAPSSGGGAFAISPTGRQSNPMYDVVHFRLQANVAASKVPAIIMELSRNKFLSVLQISVVNISAADALAAGFVYGQDPVVQLSLRCEALFLREWTVPIMPETVKTALGAGAPAMQPE